VDLIRLTKKVVVYNEEVWEEQYRVEDDESKINSLIKAVERGEECSPVRRRCVDRTIAYPDDVLVTVVSVEFIDEND
jgi:hypothetical protein